jgi:4-hydroxy-2-oxoheptanedioate aldolase
MQHNPVKQKLLAGIPALGVFAAMRSALASGMLARAGCDYVLIDNQHGEWDDAGRLEAIRAVYLQNVVPMARVRANDYGLIGRALDSGILGVVVPMVNTAAEARAAAAAMRYPPLGSRSTADNLAVNLGTAYGAWANAEVFLAVQIETAEGLANAAGIMAVDGVDACLVGPADLALSLGVAQGSPRHTEAVVSILETCQSAGKIPGIFAGTPALARHWIEVGYRFITVGADSRLLETAMQQTLQEVRQEVIAAG